MRVVTEDVLVGKAQALDDRLRELRAQTVAVEAERRVIASLLAQLVDVPASVKRSNGAVTGGKPKKPGTAGSVAGPLLGIVREKTGIHRQQAQRKLVELTGTTMQSARETVRRLLRKGVIRMDDQNRLFPGEGVDDDPGDGSGTLL